MDPYMIIGALLSFNSRHEKVPRDVIIDTSGVLHQKQVITYHSIRGM